MQNPILGLTLSGFQTFEKPTFIPLRTLTLLFGPNSVGKSAIADALDILVAMDPDHALFGFGKKSTMVRRSLLERHWRRHADGQLAPTMEVALHYKQECSVNTALAGRFNSNQTKYVYAGDYLQETRWKFYFQDPDAEPDFSQLSDNLIQFDQEVWFDGEIALAIRGHRLDFEFIDSVDLYYAHPIFENGASYLPMDILANSPPEIVQVTDRKISLSVHLQRPTSAIQWYPEFTSLEHSINPNAARDQAIWMMLEVVNEFLSVSYFGNARVLHDVVDASRRIPNKADMRFLPEQMEEQFALVRDKTTIGDLYWQLMESLARSAGIIVREQRRLVLDHTLPGTLAALINDWLSRHLFIENCYRVAVEIEGLYFGKEEIGNRTGLVHIDNAILRLGLRDGQNRHLAFEDVGSGIGYILPVLISLARENFTSVIQQPELHLHPALQAAMGDVIIEAACVSQAALLARHPGAETWEKQFIIETHSEYILLRILKRIRQNFSGVALDPHLRITPDDVSVLYFSPEPDGTTSVKQLRISETGEFMDRWPRGFFPERDQELFDE